MYQISYNPGHKCSFRPSYIHCTKDLTKCLHVFPFNTTPALMHRADNQCTLLDISACYQKYHFWGGGAGGRHLQGICASNATFITIRKKILLDDSNLLIIYAHSKMKIMSCCTVKQNYTVYESYLITICMVNKMASFCCKIVKTCWKQPLLHFVLKDKNF